MKEILKTGFTLENAIQLASEAHKGQVDKSGKEYILHPTRVMNRLEGDDTKIVGILHDVVEDTDVTIDDLRKLGLKEKVVEAILLLTHPEDYKGTREEYFENIQKIADSKNQFAIDTKFSDLLDNSDLTRIENPTEKDHNRVKKYQKAMHMLRPFVSSYLQQYK